MAEALKPKWGQPNTGLIALGAFTIIAWVVWRIVLNPQVEHWEQPWLAYIAWLILVAAWMHLDFQNWPFEGRWPQPYQGLVMWVVNFVGAIFMVEIFFQRFFGKYVCPIFSYEALQALGVEAGRAHAISYGAVTLIVLTGFVTYAMPIIYWERWPVAELKQPEQGLVLWFIGTFNTILFFWFLFWPYFSHVALGQVSAGAYPWWADIAGSPRPGWTEGWWEWMVIYIFMVPLIWKGLPWSKIPQRIKQPWRGWIAFLAANAMAIITMYLLVIFVEPVFVPSNIVNDWSIWSNFRWAHALDIACFTLMPFIMWAWYFDNWPKDEIGGEWGGFLIRTVGTFFAAAVIYVFYYSGFGVFMLNLKHELPVMWTDAHPAAWHFWWILLPLWNEWFFHKWPFYER